MAFNTGGFEYEQQVIDTLIEANICGQIKEGAGSSACDADADMIINGQRFLVEVKKDLEAQMGGTSLRFADDNFKMVNSSVDSEVVMDIISSMSEKKQSIKSLLEYIGGTSFPVTCEKDRWEEAKKKGMLQPINSIVKQDAEFICNHYKNKGIHYIQIGNAGLFHMGENPANLPIPKLEGEINLEIRAGRSGARTTKEGKKVISGGLRVQGRLKFKGKSDYSLDDKKSINKMLASLV